MNYKALKIYPDQAESIALELFNVRGKAIPLSGYIDLNFKIKVVGGTGYILKISRPDENWDYLDFQQQLLEHLGQSGSDLAAPQIIKDTNENSIASFTDASGHQRKVRLLTWIPGRIWSDVNPRLDDLRYSLGVQCGTLTRALQGFGHPQAHQEFEWDIARSLWTKAHLDIFNQKERILLVHFQDAFERIQGSYISLRKAVVHNDANDNNLIVSKDKIHPTVTAAIDYGDALHTQIINDLAVACAYAIMGHNDPLEAALSIVKGYHSAFPLQEQELEHLYTLIAMRLVVSVTKSAISKREEPDNDYLSISEKPAWELLEKWHAIAEDFAQYSFRQACGFTPHPKEIEFKNWAGRNAFKLSNLFPSVDKDKVHPIDLSVSSKWLGHQSDFNDLELFRFKIDRLQRKHPEKILAGGYLEPRTVYTTSDYTRIGNSGPENRSVHLGVDFWLPSGTAVNALFDGEVITSINDAGDKEYGGLIILKHKIETFEFFTLYGHLSITSIETTIVGTTVQKGERIGFLGHPEENGNWGPHLHFQIMLSMLGYSKDFPGVAYHRQINVWQSICPILISCLHWNPFIKTFPPRTIPSLTIEKNIWGKASAFSMMYP